MAEDAKGEYRGLAYRNDAELQAWLARRPKEAALEPECLRHPDQPCC